MYQFLYCDVKPGSNLIDVLVYEMPKVAIKDSLFTPTVKSTIGQSVNVTYIFTRIANRPSGNIANEIRYVRESPFL